MVSTDLVPTTAPAGRHGLAEALATKFADSRKSDHTKKAYRLDLGVWLGWCRAAGLDPLGDVRHADVLDWLRWLDGRDGAEATKARRLAAVGSWYRYLLRERVVPRNPCDLDAAERPQVKRDQSPTAVLSGEEREALLAQADKDGPRSAAIVWLLWAGGLRVGELLAATVEDIGWDRGTPYLLVHGKGRKERTVPLPPALFSRIDTYLQGRPDAQPEQLPTTAGHAGAPRPLLATRNGNRLAPNEVWRLLRRLAGQAGLEHLVPRLSAHSLRHTFATDALEDKVALADVQDALGHADPRTTRGYDRRKQDPDRHPTWRLLSRRA